MMLNKRRKDYYASLSREQARILQTGLTDLNQATAYHSRYKHQALVEERVVMARTITINEMRPRARPYHRLLDGPEKAIRRATIAYRNKGMSPPRNLA